MAYLGSTRSSLSGVSLVLRIVHDMLGISTLDTKRVTLSFLSEPYWQTDGRAVYSRNHSERIRAAQAPQTEKQ